MEGILLHELAEKALDELMAEEAKGQAELVEARRRIVEDDLRKIANLAAGLIGPDRVHPWLVRSDDAKSFQAGQASTMAYGINGDDIRGAIDFKGVILGLSGDSLVVLHKCQECGAWLNSLPVTSITELGIVLYRDDSWQRCECEKQRANPEMEDAKRLARMEGGRPIMGDEGGITLRQAFILAGLAAGHIPAESIRQADETLLTLAMERPSDG